MPIRPLLMTSTVLDYVVLCCCRDVENENKELYNQVQDLKGAIRVFCRIRPSGATGDSSAPCIEVSGSGDHKVEAGAGGIEQVHDPHTPLQEEGKVQVKAL